MAVIQGEQAIIRLAQQMREKDNPDDAGLLGEAGTSLDGVHEAIRAYVERTGKACKGSVTLTIAVKGYRSKGGEVAVDVEGEVKSRAPGPPKRATMLFLDNDGVAHTTPQQEEMPLFDTPRAIDGGAGKTEKKGKAAI